MQLEFLKVFCDIARLRSFSQAAAANHLSQSAVSQIVVQLEKRLATRLIDRSRRPLILTPLGQTYYEGCKSVVDRYEQLEAVIRNAQDARVATLQIAAIYSVGLGDMGLYVERFRAQQPNAQVHVEYLHPDRVYEKVLGGTADLGLVSFPRSLRKLEALPWREEEMVLACAPQHPLARQRVIRPVQLQGEKYVGFDKNLVIRREIDRFLRECGVSVEVALEFDNIENIKKAVEIGVGVALLPEPTLRREVQAGTLAARHLAGARFVRPLGIIHRRDQKPTPTAQRFIRLLQESATGAATPRSAPANDDGELRRSNGDHRPRKAVGRSYPKAM